MDAQAAPSLRVGVFGGPLDTGNLGVSALGMSVVRGIHSVDPDARVVLYDHGRGVRERTLEAAGWTARVELEGSAYSRRLWRASNQQQAWAAVRLGLGRWHPFVRRLAALDAVLDISGGDSFSDLYGDWRFRAVTMPKRLALRAARALLLLPQTYGPFEAPERRRLAAELMAGARQLWARDARSLAVARDLLGPRFDPVRHRAGVDVAFGLPARAPRDAAARAAVEAALAEPAVPAFGFNVSGLLYHAADQGRAMFGLRVAYRELVLELVRELLSRHACRLLLIPHVAPPCTPDEDDAAACRDLRDRLPQALRERAIVVPHLADPMEIKWVVGRCRWFCGTRMHACIAGLSQGVPTATLAYSDKSLGVFETAGAGDWVFDPRRVDAVSLREGVLATLADRDAMAARLESACKRIEATWQDQFQRIVAGARAGRGVRRD